MSGWIIKRVATDRPGSKRPYVWQATCPTPPAEPTWENDFGRGVRCGCARFRTEGKATRYVERQLQPNQATETEVNLP